MPDRTLCSRGIKTR